MRVHREAGLLLCAAIVILTGCQGGTRSAALPQGTMTQKSPVSQSADARTAAIAALSAHVQAFHGLSWRSDAQLWTRAAVYKTIVDGREVSIVSGTLRGMPSQGALVVIDTRSQTAQLMLGPVGAGDLAVTGAVGREVYVTTADGHKTHLAIPNPL